MPTFEQEIEIDAPIEYVFDWGNTPDNWLRTTPSLIDVEVIEETEDETRYRSTMKFLGRTVTSEERYTVDDEHWETHSVFEDGGMAGEMHWSYTETDSGTLVRMTADFEPGASVFERAINPIVSRYMRRQFRNSMQTMQDLVEAEYAADQQAVASVGGD